MVNVYNVVCEMLKQQCIFYLRKYLAYIYAFEDYKIVHELDRWDYKSR